jgi:hypothetical protein
VTTPIRYFRHAVKGTIRGRVRREDDTWIWIQLVGDHSLRYLSAANRGRIVICGEVLCLRKKYLTELTEETS